jgi:murein L,D-transpeptidase YafK
VKKIFVITFLNFALATLLQVSHLHAQEHPAFEQLVPDSLINLGKGPFYSNHVFVVDKSKRTLIVWEQSEKGYSKMKEINADFGKASGNKVSNGDHRTPEGIYFFSSYLEKAKLDFRSYGIHDVKAFPMDYPNLFDRREGKTGSGIWLHTLPDDTPLSRGSRGCVVIRNNDFDEAMSLIKLNNTPIIVQDEIKYVSPKEIDTQRVLMVTWLKKWLEAWQSKNLDNYMSFFDKSFHSKKMNYDQWRQYKSNLASTYGDIDISISEPRIVHFRDEWIVQFIQKYKSDKYEDFGHKTLYIRGTTIDDLKIIAEDFDVTTSEIAIAQYDAANFNCCSADKKLTTKN